MDASQYKDYVLTLLEREVEAFGEKVEGHLKRMGLRAVR